jgi:hypothetical protein
MVSYSYTFIELRTSHADPAGDVRSMDKRDKMTHPPWYEITNIRTQTSWRRLPTGNIDCLIPYYCSGPRPGGLIIMGNLSLLFPTFFDANDDDYNLLGPLMQPAGYIRPTQPRISTLVLTKTSHFRHVLFVSTISIIDDLHLWFMPCVPVFEMEGFQRRC